MSERDVVVYQYTDAQGGIHRVSRISQVPKDRLRHMLVIGGEEAGLAAEEHEVVESPVTPGSPEPEGLTAPSAAVRSAPQAAVPAAAAEREPVAPVAASSLAGSWLVPAALVAAGLASGSKGLRAAFLCAAAVALFATGKIGLEVGGGRPRGPEDPPFVPAAPATPSEPAEAAEASDPPGPAEPPTQAVSLASVDGNLRKALGPCPAARCLTVYLAPWCPACQQTTPRYLAMRKFLAGRGIPVYVVVGAAEFGDCLPYARKFGPDTMLDPDSELNPPGFPDFIITDSKGSIRSRRPGNLDSDDMETEARALGLI